MARSQPRTIDAPPRAWSTDAQARGWLGWTARRWRAAVAAEASWLRPDGEGRARRWYWLDLVVLSHLSRCRAGPPPPS